MTGGGVGDVTDRVLRVAGTVLDGEFTVADVDAVLANLEHVRYDSVTVMEFVAAIEQEFDLLVDFVTDDVRFHFRTLGAVSRMVREKLADVQALGGAGG